MDKNFKTKKYGFTLAEVLITLGIIGVIAGMTIPTLVTNQQKQATAKKLAKVYSVLNQAYQNAQMNNGESSGWSEPTTDWSVTDSKVWWDENFIPYANLSYVQYCHHSTTSVCSISDQKYLDGTPYDTNSGFSMCTCGGCYVLKDGMTLLFAGVSSEYANIQVDINGKQRPNTIGKDIFIIDLRYKKGKMYMRGNEGLYSRTELLSNQTEMCNKESGSGKGTRCGAVIQMDGWEIKDDYPW